MNISQRIKNCRIERQLTQEEVAEKLFVSRQTISNWETGKTSPDIESLISLSNLYEISLDQLIKEDPKFQKRIKIKSHYDSFIMGFGAILVFIGFFGPDSLSLLNFILGFFFILSSEYSAKYLEKFFSSK
ncbi:MULTISPECIES: helix-turn-helix domain-containing protein [Enterococcus]|uniref:helix-turn-helix domain-containing protein n=1 Tax=Enterococcus TaxID=1350 RepID=UPI0010F5A08B|nr:MULTISPECIES: helix-turn-helix transcriptional regulator [Enterococcus]KAF1300927.1 hypothetical protein BAU16_11140 [Enterococcus sp. JM9B]